MDLLTALVRSLMCLALSLSVPVAAHVIIEAERPSLVDAYDLSRVELTPLMRAAVEGDAQTLRRLLADPSTDVNAMTPEGWTALHCASTRGHTEAVLLLLEAGADRSIDSPAARALDASYARVSYRMFGMFCD